MRSFLDLNHPFFRPLWRRVAVVAVCFGWAAFEVANGALLWGALFAGLGAIAAWQFFLGFDPDKGSDRK
jgi:hypothetical protein